jgi:hypothetical protein
MISERNAQIIKYKAFQGGGDWYLGIEMGAVAGGLGFDDERVEVGEMGITFGMIRNHWHYLNPNNSEYHFCSVFSPIICKD